MPKLLTGTNSVTVKLSDIITRQTDFAFCGPKNFTANSNSGLTSIVASNSAVKTHENPILSDPTTGLIDVEILINYDTMTSIFNELFLKPSSPTKSGQTNIKILVGYCERSVVSYGESTLTLNDSSPINLT